MVELFGKARLRTHAVNGGSDIPVRGDHHDLALHQPAGGILRVLKRLFDDGPVGLVQRVEHRLLLLDSEILDKVDDVIRIEVPDKLLQLLRQQLGEQFLLKGLVNLRNDLAVEMLAQQRDRIPSQFRIDLFKQVGNVGDMERVEQPDQPVLILALDRPAHLPRQLGGDPVGVFVRCHLWLSHFRAPECSRCLTIAIRRSST